MSTQAFDPYSRVLQKLSSLHSYSAIIAFGRKAVRLAPEKYQAKCNRALAKALLASRRLEEAYQMAKDGLEAGEEHGGECQHCKGSNYRTLAMVG